MHQHELLNGISVIELSQYSSSSYAGRLLSLSGAHVRKMMTSSLLFCPFCDSEKTILSTDQFFDGELEGSDIIISDRETEAYVSYIQKNIEGPFVHIQIDYPFTAKDEEVALQSRYSWTHLTGDPAQEPLFIGGKPASYLLGAHIATAALLGLMNKVEETIHIDINNIMVSALEGAFVQYKEDDKVRGRVGNRHHSLSPMAILPTAGKEKIFVSAPTSEHWDLLATWSGVCNKEEWYDDDLRFQEADEIEGRLRDWTKTMEVDELFQMGQLFRLPFAKVHTIDQVKRCDHLNDRKFFKQKDDQVESIRLPWKMTMNDKDTSLGNPLTEMSGLRILDLTSMWSGPYCTRLFADAGAEVIKIEAPFRPDGIRANKNDQAPFFKELNRNKLSITLDLTDDADRDQFLQLVKTSDVIVDNFSPRVMENLQLTKEKLWEIQPNLIIISMSAFGETGPYRDFIGYGPTLECMGGLASLTYYHEAEPYLPGFSISDIFSGIHSAFVLLGSIHYLSKTNKGIKIDLSQYETICQIVGESLLEESYSLSVLKETSHETHKNLLETFTDCPVSTIHLSDGSETIDQPWGMKNLPSRNEKAPKFGEHNELIDKLILDKKEVKDVEKDEILRY